VTPLEELCRSPLGWPLRGPLLALGDLRDLPPVDAIDRVLGARAGIRFSPAPQRGRRARRSHPPRPYDAAITEDGEVPTREQNLHDLMNALVWAVFPRSKRALHARQHRVVTAAGRPRHGEAKVRTPEGDALAMLDEGGLLVLAVANRSAEIERLARLQEHDHVALIAGAGDARAVAFGHALYEHVAGASPITPRAMAVILPVERTPCEVTLPEVDELLARTIEAPGSFLSNADYGSIRFAPSVWGMDR
jgi:hypothetical protein